MQTQTRGSNSPNNLKTRTDPGFGPCAMLEKVVSAFPRCTQTFCREGKGVLRNGFQETVKIKLTYIQIYHVWKRSEKVFRILNECPGPGNGNHQRTWKILPRRWRLRCPETSERYRRPRLVYIILFLPRTSAKRSDCRQSWPCAVPSPRMSVTSLPSGVWRVLIIYPVTLWLPKVNWSADGKAEMLRDTENCYLATFGRDLWQSCFFVFFFNLR